MSVTVTRGEVPRRAASALRALPADPAVRLAALLDEGLELLPAPEGCGMLAATGAIEGTPVVAFATDPTVQGGAMSSVGCSVLVSA